MSIPNLIYSQFLDQTGRLHPDTQAFFDLLVNFIQQNLGPEGFVMPKQTSSNIIQLNTSDLAGAIIYNNVTHKAMLNENGIFKTITTA